MSASVDQGPMGGGLEWTIERGGGHTSSDQHGQRCLLGRSCAASAARRWRWPLLQMVCPGSLKQCDCYECGMEEIQAQAKWRWL